MMWVKTKVLLKIEENFAVKASIGSMRFSKYFHDSASTLANFCAYFLAIDMYAREPFSSSSIIRYRRYVFRLENLLNIVEKVIGIN